MKRVLIGLVLIGCSSSETPTPATNQQPQYVAGTPKSLGNPCSLDAGLSCEDAGTCSIYDAGSFCHVGGCDNLTCPVGYVCFGDLSFPESYGCEKKTGQ